MRKCPRGAAFVHFGSVIHSGCASVEAKVCVGLYFGRIPGWLRPLERLSVANETANAHALPQAARRPPDVSSEGLTVFA